MNYKAWHSLFQAAQKAEQNGMCSIAESLMNRAIKEACRAGVLEEFLQNCGSGSDSEDADREASNKANSTN